MQHYRLEYGKQNTHPKETEPMPDTPFSADILDTIVQKNDIQPDATLWHLDMRELPPLSPEDIVGILHESSVIRYSELSRKQRRFQFVTGRLLTKYALSKTLGRPIHDFALVERRNNTPQPKAIPPIAEPIYYSLAYRYDTAACVISRSQLIGLDIEVTDATREISAPADKAFNAHENAWLSAKGKDQWLKGYYELWSRKESCYKLLSSKHGGIHDDLFWQVDCLDDPRFKWTTLSKDNGLIITICQADPELTFRLTQSPTYNLDNAFDIFKR
ncbi:MAG: 4'-phosphopantetheinyl transferase superfamily protein [Oxalobacter sp.]|nr:4'-phosphopantetheinyl transferase superfamily protein [Oxalobacter sp.]